MNDPIISPWIFYFIDVSVKIQMIAVCCCVVFFFLTGNAYVEYLSNNRRFNLCGNDDYKKEFYYYRKLLKIHLTSCIVFLLVAISIPCQSTIYKMMITQHVTPANVQMVGDNVDKAIDKVVEKIIDYKEKTK